MERRYLERVSPRRMASAHIVAAMALFLSECVPNGPAALAIARQPTTSGPNGFCARVGTWQRTAGSITAWRVSTRVTIVDEIEALPAEHGFGICVPVRRPELLGCGQRLGGVDVANGHDLDRVRPEVGPGRAVVLSEQVVLDNAQLHGSEPARPR